MFPFELYDHGVIRSVSVDIFMEKQDLSAYITVVWDKTLRRSKINVSFHIKVCFLSSEAIQQSENVRSLSHKAGRGEMPGAISVFLAGERTKTQAVANSIRLDYGILVSLHVSLKLMAPFKKALHSIWMPS